MRRLSSIPLLLTALLLAACASQGTTSTTLSVAATFYPLAHFAQMVGGADVHVTQITPGGVEPHDFEPSPQDLAAVERSKVFLLQGNGFDAWAERLLQDLQANGVHTLTVTDHFSLLPAQQEGAGAAASSQAGSGSGTVTGNAMGDPHLWLDPGNAQRIVEMIRDTLSDVDPAHAEDYRRNTVAYLKDLRRLDAAYTSGLKSCREHEIVTSHNAFSYLGKRYGFTIRSIAGLSPEDEPSPRRMADIVQEAKTHGIKVIFFETLVPAKLSQAIAGEIGARTAVLTPIEGLTEDEQNAGKTYVSLMMENLEQLRSALQCR